MNVGFSGTWAMSTLPVPVAMRTADNEILREEPEAVPIAIPTSRTTMPVPSGGPMPTNTLSGHHGKRPSAFEIGSIAGTGSRILKTLTSLGDIVSAPWSKTPPSQQYGSGHASKRIKMGHPGPVRVIHTQEEGDSDEVDVLSGDGNEYGQRQISIDRARPGTSVASSVPPKRNPIHRTVSDEHQIVEAMMDSSKHARQAEEEGRRKRGRPRISQMQPRHTQTAAIDLTESDLPVNVPYKGTARATKTGRGGAFTGANSGRPETGTTSDFFRSKATANDVAIEPSLPMPAKTRHTEHSGQQDVQLSKQFVPVNGKRRGSDVNLSADELAEVDDYDAVSRVPPEKRSRQHSPFKQRREDTPPTMLSEMEPSNIKAAQLTDSGRKPAVHGPRSKKPKIDESSGNPGVDVKTIIMGEDYLEAGDMSIGLVFSDDALQVWWNGRKTDEIPRNVINKIYRASSCDKVRLVCSRRNGQSSPQIDLELTSEKGVADLMKYLQGKTTPRVDKIDKVRMEKVFNRRKSEIETGRMVAHHDEIIDDGAGTETRLLERRKQLREENRREKVSEELSNTMRKQSGSNVVDRLVGIVSGNQTKVVLSQHVQSNRSQANRETGDTTKTLRKHTSIDEFLGRLQPQNREPQLARSTRSMVAAGGAAISKDDSFSLDEELTEELRYSKLHGLGTRWKKAMIYPKMGKKKTTVDFDDLERLDDGQFLNDNLIGFYLRYLECKLEKERPDIAKKVYWFNTYFFASLTQTARGKRGINYEAVRKWTRTIDLFSHDYAVVPINESAHWYVALICNLRGLDRMPEVGGGDGSSSPPFEGFDGAEEVESVPEQSILQSAGFIDPSREAQELENPEARARESFAELKLGDEDATGDQDKNTAVRSENEMSNDGKVVTVPTSEVEPSGTSSEPKNDNDTIAVQVPDAQKTPAPQKKGKRKPAPSPRTFTPAQPAIITLDSLGLAHSPTVRALKDYLHEEMKDKRGLMDWEDHQMKGITAKQIPLQNNYCDCGLFLLGYMDKFAENPRDFVTKLLQRGYDEKKDWPKLIPNEMRTNIRELVQDLHTEQEGEKIADKRKGPVKASAPISTKEQATQPSPPQTTEKQASDKAENTQPSGANGVQRGTPATREEALQSALPLDAPDPTPSKISGVLANGLFQHNPVEHPEPIVDTAPDLPSIVLDSQEEPTTAPTATTYTIQDEDDDSQAQLPEEAVMEIPDTPPRAQTRGKPTPEPEIPKISASPRRGRRAKDAMKSPVQQMRDVITIADN